MKIFILLFAVLLMAGCGKMCEFGKGAESSGIKCAGFFAQADEGMTMKQIEERLGVPQKKSLDVESFGKKYEEVWVYETQPPTVLYFKNGILEKKEYQQ